MPFTKPAKSPHSDYNIYVIPWRNGDDKAIGALYTECHDETIGWLKKKGLAMEEAEDCFDESFLILLHRFRETDFILVCSAKAFLYAICWNKALEIFREKDKIVRFPENDHQEEDGIDNDVLEQAEEVLRQECWNKLLDRTYARLGKVCQKLIDLLNKKIPIEKIALELEKPNANAIYQQKARCKNKWTKLIENDSKFSQCKPASW